MCAIGGISAQEGINAAAMAGIVVGELQHRGQDTVGLASIALDGYVRAQHEKGLVKDAITEEMLERLNGPLALGQTRYTTNGSADKHYPPFVDKHSGCVFALNGNLPETLELDKDLPSHGIPIKHKNDLEKAGLAIDQAVRSGMDLPAAVKATYRKMTGAFSSIVMHDGLIVAFRDRYGVRPLALGKFDGGHVVASETCALDKIGAEYIKEVEPGQMVIISQDGFETKPIMEGTPKLDLFEIIYFARPDSRLYGKSVGYLRYLMGKQLAREHPPKYNEDNVVIGVPESGINYGMGYATESGAEYVPGLAKNRYETSRGFMQLTFAEQLIVARRKLNGLREFIENKNVTLVEDSIVRGTTAPVLIDTVRALGAKTVSLLSGSPPIRFADYYGINIPSQDELIAFNLNNKQIQAKFGIEYLGYLSLGGLFKAIDMPPDMFVTSSFTGVYPIDIGRYKHTIRTPVSMEGVE